MLYSECSVTAHQSNCTTFLNSFFSSSVVSSNYWVTTVDSRDSPATSVFEATNWLGYVNRMNWKRELEEANSSKSTSENSIQQSPEYDVKQMAPKKRHRLHKFRPLIYNVAIVSHSINRTTIMVISSHFTVSVRNLFDSLIVLYCHYSPPNILAHARLVLTRILQLKP